MMGFDMKVKVVKATTGPDILEATFSGTLSCPSGPALVITDGNFITMNKLKMKIFNFPTLESNDEMYNFEK